MGGVQRRPCCGIFNLGTGAVHLIKNPAPASMVATWLLISLIRYRCVSLSRLASCTLRPTKLLYENAPHFTHGQRIGLGRMTLVLDYQFRFDPVDVGAAVLDDAVIARFQRTV